MGTPTKQDNPVQITPALATTLARALSQVANSDNPEIRAGLAAIADAQSGSDDLLVDVYGLGPALFGPNAPSVRTLRSWTKQGIMPFFRIGRLIRYNPRLVRAALEMRCLVAAKKTKPAEAALQ